MLRKPFLNWIIHFCVILIFLTGLGSAYHLSWKECLRLFAIFSGLILLFLRYREELTEANGNDRSSLRRRYLDKGGVIVALSVMFVITQFDPATSAVSFREPQSRLNLFFMVTMVLVGVMACPFFVFRWRELRFQNLKALDWVFSGAVIGVIAISLVAKKFLGDGITGSDLAANMKILSYLFIWFPVTRIYSDPKWPVIEVERGWTASLILDRWKGMLAGVTILFVSTLLNGAYRTGAVIYHYDAGQRSFQSENWEAAKNQYETVRSLNTSVDLGPVRNRYLRDLAVLYLKQGDDKAAKQTIESLGSASYDRTEASRMMGEIYIRAEKWPQAVMALEKAGEGREILNQLGEAYLHLRDIRGFLKVVEDHNYVPEVEDRSYEEKIFMGNMQFYRKDYAAALLHFQSAAQLNPGNSYSIYKVGSVYLEQKEYDSAVAQFQKVLALNPDFADAHYRLGICYDEQGRSQDAIRMYKKTVELLPNHLDGLLSLRRWMEGN